MPKVQPFRALPEAAERSPERARLAAAIERHQAALAHHNAVRDAVRRALDLRIARNQAVADAEERLAKAQKGRPGAELVARFLAGDDLTSAGTSVADAETALAASRADYEAAVAIYDALHQEEAEAERDVGRCRYALNAAVAAVVQASGAVARLIADHDGAQARLDSVKAALRAVGPTRLPPQRHWLLSSNYDNQFPIDPAPRDAWAVAIAALEGDADAPLPGDEPAPPPTA
jgi:hypothetical protein